MSKADNDARPNCKTAVAAQELIKRVATIDESQSEMANYGEYISSDDHENESISEEDDSRPASELEVKSTKDVREEYDESENEELDGELKRKLYHSSSAERYHIGPIIDHQWWQGEQALLDLDHVHVSVSLDPLLNLDPVIQGLTQQVILLWQPRTNRRFLIALMSPTISFINTHCTTKLYPPNGWQCTWQLFPT
jgi:hypothetical protein